MLYARAMRIDEYKWKFNQDLTIGDKMSMELKQAQLFDLYSIKVIENIKPEVTSQEINLINQPFEEMSLDFKKSPEELLEVEVPVNGSITKMLLTLKQAPTA